MPSARLQSLPLFRIILVGICRAHDARARALEKYIRVADVPANLSALGAVYRPNRRISCVSGNSRIPYPPISVTYRGVPRLPLYHFIDVVNYIPHRLGRPRCIRLIAPFYIWPTTDPAISVAQSWEVWPNIPFAPPIYCDPDRPSPYWRMQPPQYWRSPPGFSAIRFRLPLPAVRQAGRNFFNN